MELRQGELRSSEALAQRRERIRERIRVANVEREMREIKQGRKAPESVPLVMNNQGTGTQEYAAKPLTRKQRQRIKRAQFRRLDEMATVMTSQVSERESWDMVSDLQSEIMKLRTQVQDLKSERKALKLERKALKRTLAKHGLDETHNPSVTDSRA